MKLVLVAALFASSLAYAASAFWTGNVEYVTTATHKQGVRCEYNYLGNTFWRTFVGSNCPSNVDVE